MVFRVPSAVLKALNTVTKRRVRLEWSNDRFTSIGGTLDVYDSDFNCDATAQIRWQATCSAIDVDDRVNQLTTWVRAFLEIKGVRAQWWTIPMGVYRVAGMVINGRYTSFDLEGLEAIVRDYRFHIPRSLPLQPEDTPEITLSKLILEAIPTANIIWQIKTAQQPMAPVTFDRDRWAAIDGDSSSKSITGAYSADCYANRVGIFVAERTVINPTDPVWSITVDDGVKVSSSTTLSRENMRNVWTVWAAPSNAPVIGPVHIWDSNPFSPTYAGTNPIRNGASEATPFGIVSGFYQSPLMRDLSMLELAGRKRLALSLSARRYVEITSIFNPTLDAGDCIELIPDGSDHRENFVIEKVGYKMDDAVTHLTLRAQGPMALVESEGEEITGAPV
jgi:hypothetical protein